MPLVIDKFKSKNGASVSEEFAWSSVGYEGGIKSNAANDVKCQIKMGLPFCLFQIVKIPSLHRYTNFQTFNPNLEDFLIVFLGYTSKEV